MNKNKSKNKSKQNKNKKANVKAVQPKPLRQIKNAHYKVYQMKMIEISVYHNIFITGANVNFLYIYDYEQLRPLGRI